MTLKKNAKPFKSKKRNPRWQLVQALGLVVFVVMIFVGVWNIQVVREFFGRASGDKADILVDVQSDLGPMPRPWRNLAQGGEAFDWDMGPIVPKVKALNPDYIRIDHIYDFYEIVKKENGQLSFDFSKLDVVLDDIEAAGATPFIALSYMPPAIASDDIVSEPQNWSEWQFTVQKTIEHVSGTRNTPNVYYEVWNEPDLFGKWSRSGNRNYLTMYTYSVRGANAAKVRQEFKIGGPAITALYRNWIVDLVNHAQNNNLRLDFISWHRYNLSVDQFRKDIDEVHAWLADYPAYAETELVISEWGHDSNNHAGYDTSFSAAHTVAAAIEMVGYIDKAFVFEIEDGKDPVEGKAFWGRWGLLTHQSVGAQAKPRYNALRLLDQIGETRLNLIGKGSWVKALASRDGTDTVKMVIANYDANYSNVETVPVSFANILPGQYSITQTFLGGRSTETQVATSGAVIQTTITMPANTVGMIELRRVSVSTSTESATPQIEAEETLPLIPAVEETEIPNTLPSPQPIDVSSTPSETEVTPQSGFGSLLE